MSLAGFVFFLAHRIIGFKIFGHTPEEVPGITSVVLALFFFGGVQLLATGVLGEYIGRIYREVKHRPSFIVKSISGTARRAGQSERLARDLDADPIDRARLLRSDIRYQTPRGP